MRGLKDFENGFDTTDITLCREAFKRRVALQNRFELRLNFGNGVESDFTAFWLLCEREWAEQFKRGVLYDPDVGCGGCGSSVCDECNLGWDLENDEEEEFY